jgi:hypothetical protein
MTRLNVIFLPFRQVSEVRQGKVAAVDAAGGALTLAPHPDPAAHPLAYSRALLAGGEGEFDGGEGYWEEEEGEEEEEPPSSYDEAGTLVAEASSFTELRWVARAAGAGGDGRQAALAPAAVAAAAAAAAAAPAQAPQEQVESLGPSHYSRLGPPRPAAAATPAAVGDAIPEEGGWASLAEQLRRRREELSAEKGPAAPEAAKGREAGRSGGAPVRARRAARQAALGPMLRSLRSNGAL